MQRVFWALTEGAVASALIAAGGPKGLGAFQAAALIRKRRLNENRPSVYAVKKKTPRVLIVMHDVFKSTST